MESPESYDIRADIKILRHDLSIAQKEIDRLQYDLNQLGGKIRNHEAVMLKKTNSWLIEAVKYLGATLVGVFAGKQLIK